ncbi:PAS domain S-box protein [Fulvivirga ulvae]|uniref:PAS domain-containing response regulator n=1 Tax=Fulvivirga ulvae TaxID=2904245 RepID=UPI001F25FCF0|nr:PAS domain-containing protein [Fulvivirga ulvae]UII32934.1 PAS domain S-box protein [Fulvivirga ulvae]
MGNNIMVIGDCSEEISNLREQLASTGETEIVFLTSEQVTSGQQQEYSLKLIIYITNLPAPDALTCFKHILSVFPEKPMIVISDHTPVTGLKMVSMGAQDHLVKGEYSIPLLKKSIYYAIERSAMLKQIDKTKNEYQGIFMDNPNPMWIYDPATYKFLQVNQAAIDNYGYSKEEFLAMTIKDIRPESDLVKLQEMVRSKQKEEGVIDSGVWVHKKASGQEFYVHIYSHDTSFEGKKTRLVVAVDVDSSMKHEQKNEALTWQLKAYSDRINTILDSITDGFFAVDENWNFIYVNKIFEQLFGTPKEQLLGKNVWTVLPGKFANKISPRYEEAMKTKKLFKFEEFLGEMNMWFSVSVYPSEEGLSVYIQDITRAKKMKEEIFNEQMKLDALINNTDDLIWSVDKELVVLTANNAMKTIMKKFNPGGIKVGGSIIIDGLEESVKAEWISYYQKALNGVAHSLEYEARIPDSPTKYLEVSFNPIKNQQSEVFGVGCYGRDITERKLHQFTIEKHNRLLEEIAWKQSHKMRGPVASIMGIMSMLDLKDLNSTFNKELLKHLKTTTDNLDLMIREIVKSTISIEAFDKKE